MSKRPYRQRKEKPRPVKPCQNCGEPIPGFPSHIERQLYCSQECSGIGRKKDKRHKVFDFIVTYKQAHDGVAPSLREIQSNCRISAPTSVAALNALRSEGKIKYDHKRPRFIEVPGGRWIPPGAQIAIIREPVTRPEFPIDWSEYEDE